MQADLPFLIIHGAWIWIVPVVAVTGGAIGLMGLVRRYIARKDARARAAKLDTTDPGVVRGKLGGGSAATLSVTRDHVVSRLDWRESELWIDTGDGKVLLDGTIRVVAGARTVARRKKPPRQTPPAMLEGNPERRATAEPYSFAQLDALAPGDEVIARGTIEQVSAGTGGGYRDAAGVTKLVPGDDGGIAIAARTPIGAAVRRSILGYVVLVAVFGLGGWKIAGALGEHWRVACIDERDDPDNHGELGTFHACTLASAMPDVRHWGLEMALEYVKRSPYRDEPTVRRIAALAALAEGCKDELDELMRAQRFEDAAAEARRCGDRRVEHNALLSQGKLDEAIAIPVPGGEGLLALPSAQTLILAGRWKEAAAAADARADEIARGEHSPDDRAGADLTALHYKCLGELFRAWAGDTGAAARLRVLEQAEHGATCAPALAQLASADEARKLLERDDRVSLLEDTHVRTLLAALGGFAGDDFEFQSAESVLAKPDDVGAWMSTSSAWIAKLTAAQLPPDADAGWRAWTHRWLAVAQTFDGDTAAAAASAHQALAEIAQARERDRYRFRDAQFLPAAVALYTTATDTPFDIQHNLGPSTGDDSIVHELWLQAFGHLLVRHGDALDGAYFGPRDSLTTALQRAEAGDGLPLAHELGGNDLTWWSDSDVLAAIPRIKTGRDELARALPWATPSNAHPLDFDFPWGVALCAAVRRTTLAMLGDAAEAKRWDDIYRRYDKALSDKQRLAALILWQL